MSVANSVPVSIRPRAALVLAVASVGGLMMFLWPLFVSPSTDGTAHVGDAPFLFALILPLLVATVVAEIGDDGFDVKAIAIIGLLAGVGAVLRPLGAGTAGIEVVFFLLILAGRVYGGGFGFVLGATTMLSSALGMSLAMNGLLVSTVGTRWKLTCVRLNCGQMWFT